MREAFGAWEREVRRVFDSFADDWFIASESPPKAVAGSAEAPQKGAAARQSLDAATTFY